MWPRIHLPLPFSYYPSPFHFISPSFAYFNDRKTLKEDDIPLAPMLAQLSHSICALRDTAYRQYRCFSILYCSLCLSRNVPNPHVSLMAIYIYITQQYLLYYVHISSYINTGQYTSSINTFYSSTSHHIMKKSIIFFLFLLLFLFVITKLLHKINN